MNATLINSKATTLFHEIDRSLKNSVKAVVKKCIQLNTDPEEPDFIASLTLNFSKDLYQILVNHFPILRFSITSVYCHQKPIVDIGDTKCPELGDILFVYIFQDGKLKKHFNSLLFQAKRTQTKVTRVSSADSHQLKLYLSWPDFTYLRAGHLVGTRRSIQPKAVNDGAQYLLIDDHPRLGLSGQIGTFPMGCATPSETLNLDNNLAGELLNFLKWKSGRTFEEYPASTTDDWTKMIWDLLQITKGKASKRKNIGITSFPRQSTRASDGLCFYQTGTTSIFSELHQELSKHPPSENYTDLVDNNPGILSF